MVGLGGGTTAHFLSALPGVEKIVVVEILDDLGEFLSGNLEVVDATLADPRVRYVIDDARRYLYSRPDERYDLISIDPLRRYSSGHNNLYSLEAMELYRSHLTPNGVLCAYVDQRNILPATMAAVFPFVDQFRIRMAVGADRPLEYGLEYMERASRAYLNIAGESLAPEASLALEPRTLLSEFLRDQGQIALDERETPLLSDLEPYLEYYYLAKLAVKPIRFPPEMRAAFRRRISGCDSACQDEVLRLMNRDRSEE